MLLEPQKGAQKLPGTVIGTGLLTVIEFGIRSAAPARRLNIMLDEYV